VNTVAAPSRERVSVYRSLLWVWHRLDVRRWRMSKIPLRYGKSKKTALEVDHTVAFALWERILASGLPAGVTDQEEAQAFANLLGNCCLLDKTFNISKSDKSLKSFLEQIHEFKSGQVNLHEWSTTIAIPLPMLEPTGACADNIAKAIQERDKLIRSEVAAFVMGVKPRADD
jgi:hypothetical protein